MKNSFTQLYDAILDRIRTKLAEQELTQAEVGNALGIKQSAVSYLLKGKTKLTLEQFMALSSLIGERPQQVLTQAEAGLTESRPLPSAVGRILYKTGLHLLVFCAAGRPVRAAELANSLFTGKQVDAALAELVEVGLVVKQGDTYVQKDPHVVYRAQTQEDQHRVAHVYQELNQISLRVWETKLDDKAYRSLRFNMSMVDYFTPSQMREVEEFLWRAVEKLRVFQRENIASGYTSATEDFMLWHPHLMLMTPLAGS
jgi:predicted transcriptional regulator